MPGQEDYALERQLDMAFAKKSQNVAPLIGRREGFAPTTVNAPRRCHCICPAPGALIMTVPSCVTGGRNYALIPLTVVHGKGNPTVELSDDGFPFDPRAHDTETQDGMVEQRRVGGLEITLVKSVIDPNDCERDGGFCRDKQRLKEPANQAAPAWMYGT